MDCGAFASAQVSVAVCCVVCWEVADFFGGGARGTAALPQHFGVKKLARTEKNSAYSPGFFITHTTPVRKK